MGVVGWVQGYKIQSSELGWNFNSKYANLFAQVSDIDRTITVLLLYNCFLKYLLE